MLDVLITGGLVVDGTGSPARRVQVGVRQGHIVAIGPDASATHGPARRTIDAAGLVVAPGFVDPHTHYDAQLLWDPAATPSCLHGVTTVIGGNCGFTVAPLSSDAVEYVRGMLARVEGMPLSALEAGLDWRWQTFGEWLDLLDGGLSVNAGFLVGHSTLRRTVMGERAVGDPGRDQDLVAMVALLHESLKAGGLGFSTSRAGSHSDHRGDPVPSRHATLGEILALCRVVSEHEGTTAELVPTIEPNFSTIEHDLMTAMSLAARRPVNWNMLTVLPGNQAARASRLAASDHARARGATVLALAMPDAIPIRLTFETGVLYDTLPGWAPLFALPIAERLAALREPEWRARLAEGARTASHRAWADLAGTRIGEPHASSTRELTGRSIGEIAAERGVPVVVALCDVLIADGLRTGLLPPTPGDDPSSWAARAELWRDPRVVLGGSDAGAHLDMLQAFGYTSDFVGVSVRDRRLIGLEAAVRLVTDVPARLYGLRARGRIAQGYWADLVLFDPERLRPRAAIPRHDLPGGAWRLHGGADGIERVLVNGIETVRNGELTGSLAGRLLRSGRDTETVAIPG